MVLLTDRVSPHVTSLSSTKFIRTNQIFCRESHAPQCGASACCTVCLRCCTAIVGRKFRDLLFAFWSAGGRRAGRAASLAKAEIIFSSLRRQQAAGIPRRRNWHAEVTFYSTDFDQGSREFPFAMFVRRPRPQERTGPAHACI